MKYRSIAVFRLSCCCDRCGRLLPQSLTAYGQALRLEPDARTYYNRHKVFLQLSKLNDALADLSKSIALDSTFVMVRAVCSMLVWRGRVCVRATAASALCGSLQAYLQRGGLRLMHGYCADAVEDFTTVMRCVVGVVMVAAVMIGAAVMA